MNELDFICWTERITGFYKNDYEALLPFLSKVFKEEEAKREASFLAQSISEIGLIKTYQECVLTVQSIELKQKLVQVFDEFIKDLKKKFPNGNR